MSRNQSFLSELCRYSLAVLMLAGLSVRAADPPSAPPQAAPKASEPTVAARIVDQTNAARTQRGLSALKTNAKLEAAAKMLADHMARTGAFGHQADGRSVFQRVQQQQYQWSYAAENIAFQGGIGSSNETMAQQLMGMWLRSSGHYQNIMSFQAQEIGVATAQSANGSVYAVQVFGRP